MAEQFLRSYYHKIDYFLRYNIGYFLLRYLTPKEYMTIHFCFIISKHFFFHLFMGSFGDKEEKDNSYFLSIRMSRATTTVTYNDREEDRINRSQRKTRFDFSRPMLLWAKICGMTASKNRTH